MNAGFFWPVLLAAFLPHSDGCQLPVAENAVYQRAISPATPLAERSKAFQQVIRACPEDARLYGEFASLLVANRDFEGALPWIDAGLKRAPEDAVLNLREGEALVALGRPKDALTALKKAPETGESQFFRGLAYQLLLDHPAARRCFVEAWESGDEDPYVLYSLIREDREMGDKAGGMEHFKIMLTKFPDSAWIHILLGDAHFQKSEESEARKEYLTAAGLMPDLFEANFRLAYLAFEGGDFPSAVDYYRRALSVKPHHTEANIYLGEALRREGKLEDAVIQQRKAIELDRRSALAYDSLAKALTDLSRLGEAANVLAQAEKEFPDESSFPAMRARVLSRLGKGDEAKADAQRAEEIIAARNKKVSVVNSQ